MEDRFATIVRSRDINYLYFLRSVLEAQGIDAFIEGENYNILPPGATLMNKGPKLCVPAEQAYAARTVLSEAEDGGEGADAESDEEYGLDGEEEAAAAAEHAQWHVGKLLFLAIVFVVLLYLLHLLAP